MRSWRQPVNLTPQQREAIQTAARQLRPDKQYAFVLTIEGKLETRRQNISDALIADIIRNVFEDLEHRP